MFREMTMMMMCVFFALSLATINGFDLGPTMRIAQCRSLCLQRHLEVKGCRDAPDCYMCWETCGLLENDWTVWGSVCQDDEEICFSGCKTACAYHATRVEEQFLPSTLPSPMTGPVRLGRDDVAVIFRKFDNAWVEMDQHSGEGTMPVNKTTWIVVVAENGVRQYSGEYWKPNLETLKEGALFEASLSWTDADDRENRISYETAEQQEIDNEVIKLSSRMTLDFENDEVLRNALSASEGTGKKTETDSVAGADRFDLLDVLATPGYADKNFVENRKRPLENGRDEQLYHLGSESAEYYSEEHDDGGILSDTGSRKRLVPKRGEDDLEDVAFGPADRPEIYRAEPTLMETTSRNGLEKRVTTSEDIATEMKHSYVVSWEPEAGGLMGNQITDARSTQISLLPGTKYLVRVASNDGPGSFALEIDTATKSVGFAPLEAAAVNFQPWAILAGTASALTFVALLVIAKLYLRRGSKDELDFV